MFQEVGDIDGLRQLFRSVSGLPPAPYLDQPLTQLALEQNNSDHLPLKRFLHKNTQNIKVDNWAVELETYSLKFEYIQGIKNTLADTLS